MLQVAVVAASVGVVILAGAYVVWGSDQLFRRKARCPGLVNLGNTCFLNAVLQALASLKTLKLWIVDSVDKHNGPLTKALHQVLTVLCADDTSVYSPDNVLRALAHHRWKITFEQQDAHELYHVLVSTLEDEMALNSSSTLWDMRIVNDSKNAVALTRTGRICAPYKRSAGPLRGMMRGLLQCCVCKQNLPTRCEYFYSLSLTLQSNGKECSLDNCLQQFVQPELVDNVDCPSCSKIEGIPVKRTFLKQLQLGALPNCLCIHINRTVWQYADGLNKNVVHMSFPLKLNMGHYTGGHNATGSVRLYSLQSIIEHIGGPSSGHYTTYRKILGRKSHQWVHLSDTAVYSVDVKDVLHATAFMLFYEKVV